MAANLNFNTLVSSRRTLVELMRRLHYGQILGLLIRGGNPAFDPAPKILRDVKLSGESAPRPPSSREDFLLKEQVVELLRVFDQVQDGVIELIEVKDGLPFRVRHAAPLD
jgi:hypothetical protein